MASTMPHRTMLPYSGFTLRETALERVQAALAAVAICLFVVCGVQITVWLLMLERDGIPGPRPIPDPPLGGPILIASADFGLNSNVSDSLAIESPDDQDFRSSLQHSVLTDAIAIEQIAEFAEPVSSEPGSSLDNEQVTGESTGAFGTDATVGEGSGQAVPLHRRWVIQFGEPWTVEQYAECLDQLGIEVCAVQTDGQRIYLRNLSTNPVRQSVSSTERSRRFAAAWSDGELQQLDSILFDRAHVDVSNATIVHVFTESLVQELQKLEMRHDGLSLEQIRRTTFSVRKSGNRFQLVVVSQRQR